MSNHEKTNNSLQLDSSKAPDPILEARDLCKAFGGVQAVVGVSFDVHANEILAIIGPNGAGKTTTFNLVSGIYSLDSGSVRFKGKDIHAEKPFRISALGLSRTFQHLRIFSNMTVLENVMVGCHLHGRAGLLAAALRLPRARNEERRIRESALEFLDIVGLTSLADQPADSLSFGQQRLLEITRSLATKPKLLMLDEPGAGLTYQEKEDLLSLIRGICEQGTSVLLVEHDMEMVMGVADRVLVLDYGQLIAEGRPDEVQADPKVIEAYLGVGWGEHGFKPEAHRREGSRV